MPKDEQYIQRCIQLAKLGEGNVAPNPMVGAVIVYNDKIIGEGYHQNYGEAHAEVNAINSVDDQSLLAASTIYVSLEPCAHFGKTPPCADLIVINKFNRVVIGCQDSFSKVEGKGIKKLKDAGIEVDIGVLELECRELNKRFFTFHEKKRPFVLLKWAETKNGLIDNGITDNKDIAWISAPELKPVVHSWRNQQQAILVGQKTVISDNPSLTVRAINGTNPTRIIIDPQCNLNNKYSVFNSEAQTIVLNSIKDESSKNIRYIKLEEINTKTILEQLYLEDIQSVLIEGGRTTLQSFIDDDLWDEANVIIGQNSFNKGTKAPILCKDFHEELIFGDRVKYYSNK